MWKKYWFFLLEIKYSPPEMLVRNLFFRSSVNTRSPHFILWRNLLARRLTNHINSKEARNQSISSNFYQQANNLSDENESDRQLQHQVEQLQSSINDHQPHRIREVSVDVEFPQPHIVDIEKGYKQKHQQFIDENGCYTNKLSEQTPTKKAQPPHLQDRRRSLTNGKKKFQPSLCFRVASVSVGLVCLTCFVTLLWYYLGWMLGLPALILAIIAILLTTVGWRWFYIAAVTSKRDIT